MMIRRFLKCLFSIGLMLIGQSALADGPCPDGTFNPQSQVCMCSGGGYVAPGNWCEVKIVPVPKTWGAIAIDMSSGQKKAGFGKSEKSQADANQRALALCGLSTCQVALTFRNSCGAITKNKRGIWGGGLISIKIEQLRKQQMPAMIKALKIAGCGWNPAVRQPPDRV